MGVLRGFVVVLFLLVPASLAVALDNGFAPVELTGIGSAPIMVSAESISSLPVAEKDVSFQTSKGPSSGHYKGVLFFEVLTANKAFEGLERNGELKKTILVSAADGYQIAFSVGEIHPDFGNVPMMLATEADGKPLERLRIIMPGDKRGARNVTDVTKIDIR